MAQHLLDTLLCPQSVALIGASDKPDSNGHAMVAMCSIDGFEGRVYPVNPRLTEIDGLKCYPDVCSLPEIPEHVAIGVGNNSVEGVLDQVISIGVKSATIFASCFDEDDKSPALAERIRKKASDSGIAICGANCMGFYNTKIGLRVASVDSPPNIRKGGIAWISQSGSTFGALAHNDRRLGFVLCVSTGMELVNGVPEYMDWAIHQSETRVIGLFIETVRHPELFVKALEKARTHNIPVVVLKVGRSEKSAEMALTHTGAQVGNDTAYEALFRKFGVIRVSDMDEMAATLALFDCKREVADGQLATIHDSGGERELIVDLAADVGVEFADVSKDTCNKLAANLEPGLVAENPLDAYGTHFDFTNRLTELIVSLMNDSNVSMGFFMANPRDNYGYAQLYVNAIRNAATRTSKLIALVSNYSMTDEREIALSLLEVDVPVIRGTRSALLAARSLINHRDFQNCGDEEVLPDTNMPQKWKKLFCQNIRVSEQLGLQMLSDFGLRIPKIEVIESLSELETVLTKFDYPIVIKTAEEYEHKSEVGGVDSDIWTNEMARNSYAKMCESLGARAIVMEKITDGIELALGAIWDRNFGPVVMVSAGGIFIENLHDRVVALAPFDENVAQRLVSELKIVRILKGVRGRPPINITDLAQQISKFSNMIAALGESLCQIDVNPIICTESGATAVDCLVVANPSCVRSTSA